MPNQTETATPSSRTAAARVVVAARTRSRREQLAAVLRRSGFKVRTGAPAAAAALVNRSDVVVLEWHAETPMLRSGPPVIALIPKEHPGWVTTAIEAGVSDYVLGPVTTDELVARVSLASRRASRSPARTAAAGNRATELTLRCATDGTIISASGSARAIMGLGGDELIALPWPGLAHPEEAEQVAENLGSAFADPEGVVAGSHRVRRKDGSFHWVETRCRVVSGVAEIVVRDVSETRRERDREAGLRRLATMIARDEPPESTAGAAVGLVSALLDASGVAIVGPEGPIAASDAAMAELVADGLGDHAQLQSVEIPSSGVEWGSLIIHRAEPLAAKHSVWLASVAEVVGLGMPQGVEPARSHPASPPEDFARRLERELARASRYGRTLSLAMVGVVEPDSTAPDSNAVAEQIEASLRAGEVLSPLSDSRIAWLLPESDGLGAWQAVERMRFLRAQAGLGPAALTAGIASLGLEEIDSEALLVNAHLALDVALRNGGDTAVIHTPVLADLAAVAGGDLAALIGAAADVPFFGSAGRAISEVATAIAAELGWSAADVARISDAARVQDLGKAALPVSVLTSPGVLESVELSLVQAHPATGARLAAEQLDGEQQEWVHSHHERWDGDGYPDGLAADEISEGALILGLADAWVAMLSDRPYRSAMTTDGALAECERCSVAQFWPEAVEALTALVRRGRLSREAA